MDEKRIILASQSSGRRELMDSLGISYDVVSSDYDEDFSISNDPKVLVETFARGKAQDVAVKHPEAIVIGADTVVVLEGEILGKPHTVERAREMLHTLSGKTHHINTGMCVIADGKEHYMFDDAPITLKAMTDEEIAAYSQTEESLTGAGAYKVQGEGGKFVESHGGDRGTIVGLPLEKLKTILANLDIELPIS